MITLKRDKNSHEFVNKLYDAILDDPRYLYYFQGDYSDYAKEIENPGWTRDRMLIMRQRETVGFVGWNIARGYGWEISGASILVAPKSLGTGVGAAAAISWLDHVLADRGARRVEFRCIADNEPMRHLYDRMVAAVGGRQIGICTEAALLRDGRYYDEVVYEILGHKYKPDKAMLRKIAQLNGGPHLGRKGETDGTQDDG
jgi:RimJ/RimL family protein N-acetyltransferase